MNDDILDLKEFLERVQDDKELLLELLDIFQADFQDKRQKIKEALQNKNYEDLRSLAHSLKGASGNISAKALWATFFKFEEISKKQDLTEAEKIFSLMDAQFATLQERIKQLQQELNP